MSNNSNVNHLITDNIDLWTSAIKKRNATGRGSSKKIELSGIKKLRDLILELAVRGKLVPQDANDELASVLLEKIAEEKAQLIADKNLSNKKQKQKPLPEITDEEKPFELPIGWQYCRLQDSIDVRDGTHDSPKDAISGDTYPLVTSKDFKAGDINFESARQISAKDHFEISKRSLVEVDDILFSMIGGNIGNQVIVKDERPFSIKNVALFKYYDKKATAPYYFKIYTENLASVLQESAKGGAQPFISLGALRKLVFALPPLAEQHRIVAKVDELMALCDQLEQQTEESLSAHQTLVKVLLATLTDSDSAVPVKESFQTNWQRISEHFDLLFTTENSIEQLKQTILQLAVMGKLVPQNSNDEPASVLLEKIAKEKAQLIADKKIKKQKELPAVTEEEKEFELPIGWQYCRLQDSIDVRDGTHDSPKDAISGDTYPLVTSKDFKAGDINFESARQISAKDHFEISKRSLVEVDDILFSMIGGNIGNQVIVKDERPFSIKNVALFKYYDKKATAPYYFKIYTENLASVLQESAKGGAQPFISLGALRKLVFALPPLAEQHRIVSKVDKLMVLCEQLKTRLSEAQTTQLHLADAVVSNALNEVI